MRNFQSHVDSTLEFADGFNLILGRSDSGKSSILRAVNWVRTNKPGGAGFIRKGEKFCRVFILGDSYSLSRERTENSTGKYSVGCDGQEFDYSAMGGNVPPQVTELLNLADINVQLQLDGHFLILDSPGQVARVLNSVTKLEELTSAVGILKSQLSTTNRILEASRKRFDVLSDIMDQDVDGKLETLRKIRDEVINLTARRDGLSSKRTSVISLLNQMAQNIDIEKGQIAIDKLQGFLDELFDSIDELLKTSGRVPPIEALVKSSRSSAQSYNQLLLGKTSIEESLVEAKKSLVQCPYCGSKLTEESTKKLLGV